MTSALGSRYSGANRAFGTAPRATQRRRTRGLGKATAIHGIGCSAWLAPEVSHHENPETSGDGRQQGLERPHKRSGPEYADDGTRQKRCQGPGHDGLGAEADDLYPALRNHGAETPDQDPEAAEVRETT